MIKRFQDNEIDFPDKQVWSKDLPKENGLYWMHGYYHGSRIDRSSTKKGYHLLQVVVSKNYKTLEVYMDYMIGGTILSNFGKIEDQLEDVIFTICIPPEIQGF